MAETLTEGMRGWAERQGIKPADFARKTGYSYQHAYQLLRGNAEVMDETLGRVARCYGLEAVEAILGSSSQQESSTVV